MRKPTNDEVNKALDDIQNNKRVYKQLYKNETSLLRKIGAMVTRGNERAAKQKLKRL